MTPDESRSHYRTPLFHDSYFFHGFGLAHWRTEFYAYHSENVDKLWKRWFVAHCAAIDAPKLSFGINQEFLKQHAQNIWNDYDNVSGQQFVNWGADRAVERYVMLATGALESDL